MSQQVTVQVFVGGGEARNQGRPKLAAAILLRMRPEMLEKIRVMAAAEERSVSNMSLRLIQEALDRRSSK